MTCSDFGKLLHVKYQGYSIEVWFDEIRIENEDKEEFMVFSLEELEKLANYRILTERMFIITEIQHIFWKTEIIPDDTKIIIVSYAIKEDLSTPCRLSEFSITMDKDVYSYIFGLYDLLSLLQL